MGQSCLKLCEKKKQPQAPLRDEKEVELNFVNYKSSLDDLFIKIENNYNILKNFPLSDFVFLLTIYHVENEAFHYKKKPDGNFELMSSESTDGQPHKSFNEEMTKAEFMIFIENKIIKNFVINSLNINEDQTQIFKEYLVELYNSLLAARIDHTKTTNPGVKIKKGSIKSLKKLYLISIAIFFCNSSNKTKVELLFNIFKDEKNNFVLSEDFEEFLFFYFLTQSLCGLRAIKLISPKYPNKLQSISSEDFINKSDAFEITDIERLRGILIENFFKGKQSLTRGEYETKFINGDFGWIFSTCGVRHHLEKHNDLKDSEN